MFVGLENSQVGRGTVFEEVPGSWWNEWAKWLKPYGGKMVAAPKKPGDGRKKPIEPAPGRYAKERL